MQSCFEACQLFIKATDMSASKPTGEGTANIWASDVWGENKQKEKKTEPK